MVDFEHGEIKELMPHHLLTPETLSISFAVGEAMRKLRTRSCATQLYAGIPHVSEKVLDLMALELNTQYYEQNLPRSVKESLVSQTLLWYLTSGTPSVLKEFLATLFDGGYTEEWYEYEGDPFWFRAYVMAGGHEIKLGDGTKIRQQVERYKNVRSWLEYVALVIRFECRQDVCYENTIHFGISFHPRGNIRRLLLDGGWHLDASEQRLTGYDSPDHVDFYPMQLTVRNGIRQLVQADGQFLAVCFVKEMIRVEEYIRLQMYASELMEHGTDLQFCMQAREAVLESESLQITASVMETISPGAVLALGLEVAEQIRDGPRMLVRSEAGGAVLEKERLRNAFCIEEPVFSEEGLDIYLEAHEQAQTQNGLSMHTDARENVQTGGIQVLQVNQLDALWKLDTTRKLDGGAYKL